MNRLQTSIALAFAFAAGFTTPHSASAQSGATAPPPVSTAPPPPPAAPPVNTSTPPVNTTPPPVGTPRTDGQPSTNAQQDVPRDANGNPLPSGSVSPTGTGKAPPAAPQPLDFRILDVDKAGSLKLDQVRGDPWLRQHFSECDANHNDEVTESEYAKCSGR